MRAIRSSFKFSLLAFLASAGSSLADDAPRIVSVNLCTDQMLMLLGSPEQISSISFLALDPQVSAMSEEAQDFPINHGQLEEIVTQKPDLVLAHEWTSPVLLAGLDRFGIAYQQYATPSTFEDIPEFVISLGEAIGQPEKASEIAEKFAKDFDEIRLRDSSFEKPATLMTYGPNGWVSASGNIASQAMELAGFDYIVDDYGLEYGGFMPLELVVTAQPEVILTSALYPGNSRSEALMGHPALKDATSELYTMKNGEAWSCGLPQSLAGLEELIELHHSLAGA